MLSLNVVSIYYFFLFDTKSLTQKYKNMIKYRIFKYRILYYIYCQYITTSVRGIAAIFKHEVMKDKFRLRLHVSRKPYIVPLTRWSETWNLEIFSSLWKRKNSTRGIWNCQKSRRYNTRNILYLLLFTFQRNLLSFNFTQHDKRSAERSKAF